MDVLKVPAIPSSPLLIAGTTIPGVDVAKRIGALLLLSGAIVFIPSIMTALGTTIFTFASFGSTGGGGFVSAVSNGGISVLLGADSSFNIVYSLLNGWLPLDEGVIMGINFIIAQWTVGTVVAFHGSWMKGVGV